MSFIYSMLVGISLARVILAFAFPIPDFRDIIGHQAARIDLAAIGFDLQFVFGYLPSARVSKPLLGYYGSLGEDRSRCIQAVLDGALEHERNPITNEIVSVAFFARNDVGILASLKLLSG